MRFFSQIGNRSTNPLKDITNHIRGSSKVAPKQETNLTGTKNVGFEKENAQDIPLKSASTSVPVACNNFTFAQNHIQVQRVPSQTTSTVEDPLVEYYDEIHAHWRQKETALDIDPNFLNSQPHFNSSHRSILVDWIIQVADEFELEEETLFLAIRLMDRFFSNRDVMLQRLQLVGVGCIFVATKFLETMVPDVRDLLHLAADQYQEWELYEFECLLLSELNWNLTDPTIMTFVQAFNYKLPLDKRAYQFAMYLAELVVLDERHYQFSPSLLASSLFYLARELRGQVPWGYSFQLATGYTKVDLQDCLSFVRNILQTLGHPDSKLKTVFEKYNTLDHLWVSATLSSQSNRNCNTHPDSMEI